MFQKQRTILYLGEGRSIDSLGVIFLQTINGLTVNSLDEYSALKSVSGWYVEDYHVPAGVVEIGQYAFNKAQFKRCFLPDGLHVISKYSFSDCESLEEITIPDSVTYIDSDAFYHCKSLNKIYIPKEKHDMLTDMLTHLKHLFIDKK